jgi:mRNA-degrading endonuclease toxin of MazEF toxin-antitoxin module
VLNERRRTVIGVDLACAGQPAVAVSDQIRAVAKERLRSRLGAVTVEEMSALEDGLRQIMEL